jgi:2-iminobutanoate/2-iminopropanoate deaminase
MGASHRAIHTDDAPAAIGPYSQAVVAGGFVFTAGQIGLDPATGAMVDGGVEAQAHRALTNLRAVLEAAGSGLNRVVKTTVFVTDMADYKAVNGVYAQYFQQPFPGRSAVAAAALPAGALVEIEAVATVD